MKKSLALLLFSLSFGLIAQAEIKVNDINKEDILPRSSTKETSMQP